VKSKLGTDFINPCEQPASLHK